MDAKRAEILLWDVLDHVIHFASMEKSSYTNEELDDLRVLRELFHGLSPEKQKALQCIVEDPQFALDKKIVQRALEEINKARGKMGLISIEAELNIKEDHNGI